MHVHQRHRRAHYAATRGTVVTTRLDDRPLIFFLFTVINAFISSHCFTHIPLDRPK